METKDLLIAIMGLISGVMLLIIKNYINELKNIRGQLSEKKYKLYSEAYDIIFQILKNTKNTVKISEQELINKMIEINKDMFIYAPDNIIRKFIEWKNCTSENPTNMKHFKIYLELLIMIRKDMGNKKSLIKEKDILRSIMSSTEEFKKIESEVFK
jgi:chorismate mutase